MVYSGNPAASPIDAVRYWLQDTSQTSPLLSDDEIRYLISYAADSTGGDPMLIAALACASIMAKYAGRGAITADGVTLDVSQLQDRYGALATSLRNQYKLLKAAGGLPVFGDNGHALPFRLGIHDNPSAPQLDDGAEFLGLVWMDDPSNYQGH